MALPCTSTKRCGQTAIWRIRWDEMAGGDFCQTDADRIENLLQSRRVKYIKEQITETTEKAANW